MEPFEAINRFLKETRAGAHSLWRSVDIRVIAARTPSLRNLITRIYLDHRAPRGVPRFRRLVATRRVVALHDVRPIEELSGILKALGAGQLIVSGEAVRFRGEPQSAPPGGREYQFSYSFTDLSQQFSRSYVYWSALTLTGHGDGIHEVLRSGHTDKEAVDRDIRVAAQPFDGLEGLARRFGGLTEPLSPARVATCEVFAPLEAQVDEARSELRESHLTVTARVGSKSAAEDLRVRFLGLNGDPLPLQGGLRRTETRRIGRGPGYSVAFRGRLPSGNLAEVFVSIGGHCAHRTVLLDSSLHANPLVASYAKIDPGLTKLQTWLVGEGKDPGKDLEHAVGKVLALCRMPVNTFACQAVFEDTVDLIAFEPLSGTIVPVECVVAATDLNRKIGLLASRSGTLARAADADCMPILATALPRATIPASIFERARQDKLSVLGQEDLALLLNFALQDASTAAVLDFLSSRVPESSP